MGEVDPLGTMRCSVVGWWGCSQYKDSTIDSSLVHFVVKFLIF